jgi:hypothetical protein
MAARLLGQFPNHRFSMLAQQFCNIVTIDRTVSFVEGHMHGFSTVLADRDAEQDMRAMRFHDLFGQLLEQHSQWLNQQGVRQNQGYHRDPTGIDGLDGAFEDKFAYCEQNNIFCRGQPVTRDITGIIADFNLWRPCHTFTKH